MRRLLLIAGLGFAALVSLIVVAWLVENNRGNAAWRQFQADWNARGEKFELSSVIPTPVPDADNLAATPLLAPVLDYERTGTGPVRWRDPAGRERATSLSDALKGNKRVAAPGLGNWETATPVDLDEWRAFFEKHPDFASADAAAKDAPTTVLNALKRFDAELAELTVAAQRPSSVFPLQYEENFQMLMPHLTVLRGMGTLVRLRALARLQAGQAEDAFQDAMLGLRLAQAVKDEPLLISQLVRLATIQAALQPVWEGMSRRQWTDAHLTQFQNLLANISLLHSYGQCLRGERTFANAMIDQIIAGQMTVRDLQGLEGPTTSLLRATPCGWLRQNQVAISRFYQERMIPVIDVERHRVFPARLAAAETAPELTGRSPYNIMAAMLVPAVVKIPIKFAHRQAGLDLAATACALERFHRARGSYPEKLADLPAELSGRTRLDLISGEPLKYARTDDGRFLLYSVGWNETDEQGETALQRKGQATDPEKGDWAWRYSP